MQIGKFVYGMVNGTIERWQTSNVDKLLREESLRFLYDLGRSGPKTLGTFVYTWEDENAISKTFLESARDVNGRSDMLNRTVIIKFNGDAMRYILDNTQLINDVELPTKQKEQT